MVDLGAVSVKPMATESAFAPTQKAPGAYENGMGDMLDFDAARLRILIERHLLHTGSARARAILADWEVALGAFVKVMPTDYRRALLDLAAERQASAIVAAE